MLTLTIKTPSKKRATKTKRPTSDIENPNRRCGGGTKACENCQRKLTRKPTKKKQPRKRKGTWRGAFKGTLDF